MDDGGDRDRPGAPSGASGATGVTTPPPDRGSMPDVPTPSHAPDAAVRPSAEPPAREEAPRPSSEGAPSASGAGSSLRAWVDVVVGSGVSVVVLVVAMRVLRVPELAPVTARLSRLLGR